MSQNFRWKKLEIGVCYYPEHWQESLWEEDLKRMLSHGIGTVRVGEFAWNKTEPEEGVFRYDFFDRFLDLAEKVGMRVIFGTPTATPPAWLTEKYPEALNARMDGTLLRHGARRHYNYTSPIYRKLCARIVEQLASHYARHPAIVGWQIDNELNCELDEFYAESDSVAFRAYLQKKYGTLDRLNECLGTMFWNQTYTDWSQLYVPRPTISGAVNPHLMLEYKKFVSEAAISFAKMQSDILRRYIKEGDFITTNGMFGNLDNHRLASECLDVYCYDSYPNFAYMAGAPQEGMRDRAWSKHLSKVRSVCPHFGIMEQQSGANGWNTGMEAPAPRQGQMTLWTMQSVAHGADYISYFRWRTSPMGTEIYWHGLLDYDNRDNRRIAELDRIAARFEKISDVAGEDFAAQVGILCDYPNLFDAELDVWHGRIARLSEEGVFEGTQYAHTPLDFVYPSQDWSRYSLLFYPHPAIMTREIADRLERYVREGGKLVLGCRVGYKDEYGKCPVGRILPGLLPFVGAEVRESTFVNPDGGGICMKETYSAEAFRELLEPKEAKLIGYHDGVAFNRECAATERNYGKGTVVLYGSTLGADVVRHLLERHGLSEPYGDLVRLPQEVELAVRGKYLFLLNYADRLVCGEALRPLRNAETGERTLGMLRFFPFEVKIFLLEAQR